MYQVFVWRWEAEEGKKRKVLPKDLFSFYWRRRSPANSREGSRCEGLFVVTRPLLIARFRTEHKKKKKKKKEKQVGGNSSDINVLQPKKTGAHAVFTT